MKLIIALCLSMFMLSGCFLAPAIDSFNKLGVTKADRMQLLQVNVKRFNEALYWARPEEALTYVADTHRTDIAKSLKDLKRSEKIMESNVEEVNFTEDAYGADIEVQVRYLSITRPTNVIQSRTEKQNWKFSVSDGWQLVSRAELVG